MTTTPSDSTGLGVRLPKLAVPAFNVYLQHALKDGSAKPIIEGLSQSGEQYTEAVDCLTA